jgi:hypothetical protein
MTQQLQIYGKLHLARILEACHKGATKLGRKVKNAMFVMTNDKIHHTLAAKNIFTYTNLVVDHRPQKDDPDQIQITLGGNIINYDGKASMPIADLDMVKLHWNSVVSIENAQYMHLDIKKIISRRRLSTLST